MAGFTTVSCQVLDPNGIPYANGTWTANFVDPGTPGKTPLINNSIITRVYAGDLDSFGFFTVDLPDNNAIAAQTGAIGTQWAFTFAAKGSSPGLGVPPAFTLGALTITGASISISAQVQAAAASFASASPSLILPGNNVFTGTNTFSNTSTFSGNLTAVLGQNNLAAFKFNNIVCLDGIKYPFTAVGLQAALNTAVGTGSETGIVLLGNIGTSGTTIALGTTTITWPGQVSLVGLGGAGSNWFNYQGNAQAFLIPSTVYCGVILLQGFTIQLGGLSGASAIALEIDGSGTHPFNYGVIRDVQFYANALTASQRGLYLNGTSPAGIFGNRFENLDFTGVYNPLVSNNDEGNSWHGIHATGTGANSTVAFNLASNDDYFEGYDNRGTGTSMVALTSAGTGNEYHITADNGGTTLNDTGGNNIIFPKIVAGTTLGTLGAGSLVLQVKTNGAVQVLGATLTGASSGNSVTLLNFQGPLGAITGNASAQTYYTYTLLANTLGAGKGIRIRTGAVHSTGAAAVVYSVTFGGTSLSNIGGLVGSTGAPTTGTYEVFNNSGVTNAQRYLTNQVDGLSGFTYNASGAAAINTTSNVIINATFNVAATDQITPVNFIVELIQ